MRWLQTMLFSAVLVAASHAALADTLDRLRDTGTIRIGFREDAAPFSYRDEAGSPAGFTVDLCAAVVAGLRTEMNLETLEIEYVSVTAENRFDAIVEDRIDLLCGATTVTLERRERVDFSLPVFVTGGSLLFRADGPQNFQELAGHSIGVRAGTTMQQNLAQAMEVHKVDATVVEVSDHRDGIDRLAAGEIAAYFGDRAILAYMLTAEHAAAGLKVSNLLLTYEPYALAMAHGDSAFRLAVDRMLSRIYRARTVEGIYARHFGNQPAGGLLEALYLLNGLPE